MIRIILSILFVVTFGSYCYSSYFMWSVRVCLKEDHKKESFKFTKKECQVGTSKWRCKTLPETFTQNKQILEEMTVTCSNDNWETKLIFSTMCYTKWGSIPPLQHNIQYLTLVDNNQKYDLIVQCVSENTYKNYLDDK